MRELRRDGVDARIVKLRYFETLSDETIEVLWPHGYPGMALEHAALMETSMMLYLAPETVDLAAAPREADAAFPSFDVYPPDPSLVPRSGALSSPHRASAAFGERLVSEFVDLVASAVTATFHEDRS
jgi:creatinine amidohydrolase